MTDAITNKSFEAEIEITPEMIEAGLEWLFIYEPGWGDSKATVASIIKSALAIRERLTITDDMLRAGVRAVGLDRIQGFSTPLDGSRTKWGAPHYVRDETLPKDKQELWRGDSQDELFERCEMERLRIQIIAALGEAAK